MEIIRFALGIRFDPADASLGVDEVSAAFSHLFANVPKKRFAGMKLYAGHFALDAYDDPDILTVVTMGEGMKKTKALYQAICDSVVLSGMLAEHRPIVLANSVARMSGLTYYGEFDKNGELSGGDASFELVEVPTSKSVAKRGAPPVFVLAPDKFKGTLDQHEVIRTLKCAARSVFPGCSFISFPIADGGDGTGGILAKAMNAVKHECEVKNAYGEPVSSELYFAYPDTAIVEMASASGLSGLNRELDPMRATSFGTGELIKKALDLGAKKIYIGLGGSATNEGGMGAACALGVRFIGGDGAELDAAAASMELVSRIDASCADARLKSCEITVICDVKNPLCGERGATYAFGSQKGADEVMLQKLESGMKNLEKLYNAHAGRSVCSERGAGAAGGMGAMLASLFGAKLINGAEAMLKAQRFDEIIINAKKTLPKRRFIAVTGEGRLDKTSGEGKAVGAVLSHTEKLGVPTLIVCGSADESCTGSFDGARVFTASAKAASAEALAKNAISRLEKAAIDAFESVKADLDNRPKRRR